MEISNYVMSLIIKRILWSFTPHGGLAYTVLFSYDIILR